TVPDSIEGLTQTLKRLRILYQNGGRIGLNFSKIRPQGDKVASLDKVAEGPTTFLKTFSQFLEKSASPISEKIACLGVLKIDHPNIFEFIEAYQRHHLKNFKLA